jgi:hypothetical protein
LSSGFKARLAGGLAGLGGAFVAALAVVFPTARDEVLAAVFAVDFVDLVVLRPRAAVFGGGALAVRVRLAALVAAPRRAVVVLALRVEVLAVDLVLALRLAVVRD